MASPKSKSSMIDLSTTYDPCANSCDGPAKPKKKVDYPCLYIRQPDGGSLPKFPSGEFTFTGKGKVISVRDPVDGENGSVEIAVLAIDPGSASQGDAGDMLNNSLNEIASKKGKPSDESYDDAEMDDESDDEE